FLGGVLVLGLLAPILPLSDPTFIDVGDKFAPWSWHHPFGTDQLGRDVLSRLVYGIRATVFLSLLTMAITSALGACVGLVSGFFRNRIDDVLMRICDVMMSFPSEVMILAIVGMTGPGLENVVIANVVAKWPWYARMVRSIVRQYSDKDYIRFAKVAGGSSIRIMMRHLLPGTAGELFVLTTLDTEA
ncbi:MAG: ABC transporter permease, partial [Bilophila wadsworthia]